VYFNFGIVTKLSLLLACAVIVTAFAVNEVYVRGSSLILIDNATATLEQETNFFRYPLEGKINQLREDARLLSQLHAAHDALQAGSSAPISQMADVFSEMLRTTSHYRNISFIDSETSREILYVTRSGSGIERTTPPPEDKKNEAAGILSSAPGSLYFSPLHLKTQGGQATRPYTLLLQVASGVYSPQQKLRGIIIIEADFSAVLTDIRQQLAGASIFYVTNTQGDYLIAPDPAQLYASDLNHNRRIESDYPDLLPVLGNASTDKITLLPQDTEHGNVLAYQKFHYDPQQPEMFLGIAVQMPYAAVIRHIAQVEHKGLLFSSLIAAFTVICGIVLLRLLIRPLRRIAEMVVSYRKGGKDIVLPTASPDEIGMLAREFQAMMRQKDEEDSVKEHLLGITKTLLGFKDIHSFANALMQAATPAVSAQIGVLYIASAYTRELPESDTLCFAGAYGNSAPPARFTPGEGLVGQCARSRQRLLLCDIPAGYLRIASATGQAAPRQVMLLPVMFENHVVGVMELATLGEFTAAHASFLEQLAFNCGVIVSGIGSTMRTEELLEETRQAAEELQRNEEELKTQQEELQVSNEEMEEKTRALEEQNTQIKQQSLALVESSRQMQEKAAELERANTYKSEFLANMSHELRTPLNSLLILANCLAANEEGNLTAEQVEEAQIIHNGGLELLELINDILDLSKVEAGKISLLPEDVRLDGVVKRLEKQFTPIARQSGVELVIRMQERLPVTLHTDAQRVEQILKNLLANAFKFTSAGSVTLQVHRAPNGMVAFSVIDTGIGIDAEKFKDIFEAFQQEDGSIDRQYGGTGLGLTIARKFAHMLGGEIQIQSTKGTGSTFTLFLPVAHNAAIAPPAPAEEPPEPSPPPADHDKTLLIIEDDVHFASTLAKIAGKRGYNCLTAPDGRSGLLMAAKHPVTAIVLDLKLPDIDGMQILEQLKQSLHTRHIPVHIVSGYDKKDNPLHKGAIGYLTKPLTQADIDTVFGKIETILQLKPRKLLVVEDDAGTQTAIHTLLKKNDIDITIASTGAIALAHVASAAYDCIILDLQLPDMTGFEWLAMLESHSPAAPPVIVYTARELSEDEHRRLRSYTGSIVIKGAHASERLLDEVTLFLHSVESSLSPEQQDIIRMQHNPDQALQGRTLLLVDDDLRNTFALSKVLKKHGLTIIIADNGEMALEKLKSESAIELVIMDIMMPVMDGYQAIREIRARPEFQHLPVIALTARAMPEEQEKCMECGANDYLTKPVDLERLLTLMRVWLFRRGVAA
jgi:CheY-like chemotaxis protein/signal transduction histidine kinase/HAMP domain-containing protein